MTVNTGDDLWSEFTRQVIAEYLFLFFLCYT